MLLRQEVDNDKYRKVQANHVMLIKHRIHYIQTKPAQGESVSWVTQANTLPELLQKYSIEHAIKHEL